jgi:hypothetical protein
VRALRWPEATLRKSTGGRLMPQATFVAFGSSLSEKFCFKAAVGVIEPHLTLISLAGFFFASRAQVKANRRVFESEIFTQLMN